MDSLSGCKLARCYAQVQSSLKQKTFEDNALFWIFELEVFDSAVISEPSEKKNKSLK